MKKYAGALLLIMATSLSLSAQEKKEKSIAPPAEAKLAFEKKFPGATKVKWGKEKNDYEVNFLDKQVEMAAVYDSKGVCRETEVSIPSNQLPITVKAYILKKYTGARIKEAAKITTANGILTYEAEVNKQDLIFDATGKFLKIAKD